MTLRTLQTLAMPNKKLFYAFSVFVGTIIGVGLFGLPYVTLASGIVTVISYFLLAGSLVIFIHLLFGEIVLRTPGTHRLPGYVDIYLGNKSKKAVLFSTFFGFYGALLAYLIIGGDFLWQLLNPVLGGGQWFYTLGFFILGSFLIWRGSHSIARVELWFLGLFFILLLFLGIKGSSQLQLSNFPIFNFKKIFLPYGVVMFSLWGISMVPEVRDLLKGRERQLKKILISGIVVAAVTYFAFIFIILGISGAKTTPDSLLGLQGLLTPNVIALGLFFGIITTFTSFLTLGLTLKKIFYFDYKRPKFQSWLLACGVPLLLLVLGFDEFIKIIGLVGAVALGIEGTLVLMIHQKAKKEGKRKNPEYEIKIPKGVSYLLSTLLIAGVVLEIIYSIINYK